MCSSRAGFLWPRFTSRLIETAKIFAIRAIKWQIASCENIFRCRSEESIENKPINVFSQLWMWRRRVPRISRLNRLIEHLLCFFLFILQFSERDKRKIRRRKKSRPAKIDRIELLVVFIAERLSFYGDFVITSPSFSPYIYYELS